MIKRARPPTPRQLEILRHIHEATIAAGFPPSLREIGAYFGITSTNGVNDHLRALIRKGCLEANKFSRSRAFKLLPAGFQALGIKHCDHCQGTGFQCLTDSNHSVLARSSSTECAASEPMK